MKRYKYLIFDADHTLIDFEADEREAFKKIFAECGRETDAEMLTRCRQWSVKTWDDVGLSNVGDETIQRTYHDLYRSHLTLLFGRIFSEYPVSMRAEEAGEKFLRYLEEGGEQVQDAEEVLAALSEANGGEYRICVATNGLHSIQTGRLRQLEKYFYRIYISEDIGVIKPLSAFFSRILSDLEAKARECLMIGDSLDSDIAGAEGAGIDSCWLNADRRPNKTAVVPDYEISRLRELLPILENADK